jgi:hypothetical protein
MKKIDSTVPAAWTYSANTTSPIITSGITANEITAGDIVFTPNVGSPWMTTSVPTLLVGERNVMQEIDELRDALLLLKREVKMEEKYPELKRLKDEYEAALSKYKTFDAIKDSK